MGSQRNVRFVIWSNLLASISIFSAAFCTSWSLWHLQRGPHRVCCTSRQFTSRWIHELISVEARAHKCTCWITRGNCVLHLLPSLETEEKQSDFHLWGDEHPPSPFWPPEKKVGGDFPCAPGGGGVRDGEPFLLFQPLMKSDHDSILCSQGFFKGGFKSHRLNLRPQVEDFWAQYIEL